MEFHHVGIATKNIEHSSEYIRNNFNVIEETEKVFDKTLKVYVKILTLNCGFKYELVSGESVKNFIKKKIDIYHVCFSVNDIFEKKDQLIENGAIEIIQPTKAALFNYKLVCFLHTEIGIIELLEN